VRSLEYLFLRHAETEVTSRREWHGKEDVPLSQVGQRHALKAAMKLKDRGYRIGTVISSDQCRAVETARVFGRVFRCAVVQDPMLRDRDLGKWAGLSRREIEKTWPGAMEQWRIGLICGPPGGETDDEVSSRVACALRDHAPSNAAPMLVISHAGLLRGLLASNGLPDEDVAPLSGRWLRLLPATPKVVVGQGTAL
jgi:broad specificity phosphatase PhoE